MSRSSLRRVLPVTVWLLVAASASAQEGDRPLVPGGIYDKPFVARLGTGTTLGGYLDLQARYEREAGQGGLSFVAERFNVFLYSPFAEFLRVAAELEVEELGEEIALELALLDFEIHPAFTLRAGVLLSPLGRFNLAHDSPAMEVVDRPLVSTEILGTTLSEPGLGAFGVWVPWSEGRVTYEVYAVNGFGEGVVTGSPDGTRVAAGRRDLEVGNGVPSVVGRLAVSPAPWLELGVSAHHGQYNTDVDDGLTVDEARTLTLLAVDLEARWRGLRFVAEYGQADLELPPGLAGVQADSQRGFYVELDARFLEGAVATLPSSSVNAAVRGELVDFDTDIEGDTQARLTLGVNFRPHPDTAFKLVYEHDWHRDRFDNPVRQAAVLVGVATYF